ncbi:hypothetical protein QIY50_07040 [Pseudomonas putida]|nr:hypothetical protein QIY50_07040 [Pseudomonas putida]
MPERLSEIFDEEKTPSANRYKSLVACNYVDDALLAAEEYRIYETSSRVADGELLARAMESPSHVKAQESEFTEGAFSEATKRGISVQQLSLTTPEKIHVFGAEKVTKFNEGKPEDKKRSYLGYVAGLCSYFREAKTPDGRRIFAVFSTPLEETPSHADIFVIIPAGREEKAAIQHHFRDAFDLSRLVAPPTGA